MVGNRVYAAWGVGDDGVMTIIAVGVLTAPFRDLLPWWSIIVANALAVLLAVIAIMRPARHTDLTRIKKAPLAVVVDAGVPGPDGQRGGEQDGRAAPRPVWPLRCTDRQHRPEVRGSPVRAGQRIWLKPPGRA